MEKTLIVRAEEAADYKSWSLPHIDSGGNILSSAEKEEKDKKGRKLAKGESIEELEMEIEQVPLISLEELEKITKQAYDEGFAKGKSEGCAKGIEEGKIKGEQAGHAKAYKDTTKKVEAEISKLASTIKLLQDPIGVQNRQIESSLLLIINRLVKAIVNRELVIDQSYITTLITDAIDVLPVGNKNITITLNAEDMEFIRANGGTVKKNWNLVEDSSVSRGGCLVSTEHSFVDSTIESRMDKIIERFMSLDMFSAVESESADHEVNALIEQQALDLKNAKKEAEEKEQAEELALIEAEQQAVLDKDQKDNIKELDDQRLDAYVEQDIISIEGVDDSADVCDQDSENDSDNDNENEENSYRGFEE